MFQFFNKVIIDKTTRIPPVAELKKENGSNKLQPKSLKSKI